ncbi:Rab family GTPase [Entamoeba nuttalli P19]|uniref:Rab family GTPase n=2 Tax=Entamoeba nuttalli TaxID=412467 RepID=K2GV89_ENTNP|nr:Rab family GTPase [Entamoeba nuttalli P19]EKE37737.1 Rab family GTPase [Entamoeba nuttalli P19]|eukprot:XP_008859921.1 Rab family GTPase [Entamoeba nuttalli P19]
MAERNVLITIALCGDASVGKTGIFKRFIKDQFSKNEKSTISCDVACKKMNVDGRSYNIQLWDTAGQEVFRATTSTYFRNRHVMLFCYDITKKESFNHVEDWIKEFEQVQRESNKTIKFLIGCKKDENANRQVTSNEGKFFAKRNNMTHFECSALNGEGVTEIFGAAIAELQKTGGIVDLDPTKDINVVQRQKRPTVSQPKTSSNQQKNKEDSTVDIQQNPASGEAGEEEAGCC